MLHIAHLRQNYARDGLHENETDENPIVQFALWFQQAIDAELREPNAMILATVSAAGKPRARVVLLKGFDEEGFVFFTNYHSHKATELMAAGWAALVFWWEELERQVRIEGSVEKISAADSDCYFNSRPRASQLGAWASPQSQAIADRDVLTQNLTELEQYYSGKDIPRPEHWGGFRVKPELIEFWQGRPNRLHDRIEYTLQADSSWLRQRLAP